MRILQICSIIALATILGGCSKKTASKPAPAPVNYADHVDHTDYEAKALGYPEKFYPKTESKKNWGKPYKATIDNIEVEVSDGPVVEVCGGCDK